MQCSVHEAGRLVFFGAKVAYNSNFYLCVQFNVHYSVLYRGKKNKYSLQWIISFVDNKILIIVFSKVSKSIQLCIVQCTL